MFRSRSWFGGPWGGRPKNRLSLEHLKYLYSILEKNTTVSESNRGLLVESLRCIAEILIWGDQHDSLVFDFFLEKNMLSYFLHIMRQKSGGSSYVCVQLLQTLNILFENIRNETSLYYLLSNNHVNSIMLHKFDFSDEDVMGYYILFLKTLSLKLNTHTIHFFYNEHTNDFPLYTEAIKFFNHPESMVRIAVRTISLNVYKVQNASMLRFIRDKTAAPYFSNLVWFIGKHILELDTCVRTDIDHQSKQKLSNLVAEHLDHLHYLSDILLLDITDLNAVLTEHLLHKLFVPLYIFSLTPAPPPPSLALVTQNLAAVLNRNVDIDIQEMHNPRVSSIVALYLLSLVFLVVNHAPLVHALAWVILNGDHSVFKEGAAEILNSYTEHREVVVPGFGEPHESLEQALDTVIGHTANYSGDAASEDSGVESTAATTTTPTSRHIETVAEAAATRLRNITDEEKQMLQQSTSTQAFTELAKPFLDTVLQALDCTENDYLALLSLCLIYAMSHNRDYLLSNNHVNSIMLHKFDFSDEDVMGYYILFLKTLSLKLNTHTIHFFYNEHTNDFPLYTEAIKFFNHPESMVRIAVRTISLNVYKVQNASMLRFIRDKTAAPYFSNLVWFIGKHILELDTCVRTDIDHQSKQKLSNLVAEHLDHLHYLSDILLLDITDLNAVLTEHLLHKLFVPLYIFSLTPAPPPPSLALVTQNLAAVLNRNVDIDIQEMHNPRVSSIVALYLLSLVFLVVNHAPLVHALAWVILNGDHSVFKEGAAEILNSYTEHREVVVPGFGEPHESLEQALDTVIGHTANYSGDAASEDSGVESTAATTTTPTSRHIETVAEAAATRLRNITDEEKQMLQQSTSTQAFTELAKPFLDTVLQALDCTENDYLALLSLCLIYAMSHNRGMKNEWFEQVLSKSMRGSFSYKTALIEHLLNIITHSSLPSSRIRLITVEIALELLLTFTKPVADEAPCITATQQGLLFSARNQSMVVLRNFYKSEDIFLDLFEDEYNEMCKAQLNVEFLCMDSNILLPPTGTPLTGIGFTRRLPCGEVEKARRAIRVYFLLRRTCQKFLNEKESLLPLTNVVNLVQVENVLDLNNSDLIACTVVSKENAKQRRFLVIDALQLILVEPDAKLLGWGVAKFVGFLQDVEVQGDKDDSRCLHITVHRGGVTHNRTPQLSAKFLFDDHIRCMAAKQRLTKGRSKARQKKMYQIAQLIEIPGQLESPLFPVCGTSTSCGNTRLAQKGANLTASRVPGFAAVLRGNNSAGISRTQMAQNRSLEGIRNESGSRSRRRSPNAGSSSLLSQRLGNAALDRDRSPSVSGGSHSSSQSRENSQARGSGNRSRESSPRMPRPRSEEIPLEDFQHSRNNSPHSRSAVANASPSSRSHTPSRVLHIDQVSVHSGSPREPSSLGTNALLSQLNGGVTIAREVLPAQSSEETSFIGNDVDVENRRKGRSNIETV